jgi:hypothetical protein
MRPRWILAPNDDSVEKRRHYHCKKIPVWEKIRELINQCSPKNYSVPDKKSRLGFYGIMLMLMPACSSAPLEVPEVYLECVLKMHYSSLVFVTSKCCTLKLHHFEYKVLLGSNPCF